MTNKVWFCPKHHKPLHTIPDYTGALLHGKAGECPDIFTVVDGHLCYCGEGMLRDVVTGENRFKGVRE